MSVTDAMLAAGHEAWLKLGLMGDQPFGGDLADLYLAMQAAAQPSGDAVERVIGVIERYGEGLVPELRIVTNWLAEYFRNDEDAKAAFATPAPVVTNEAVEQIISAWAFAHDIDGAARNDLFARLKLRRTTCATCGGEERVVGGRMLIFHNHPCEALAAALNPPATQDNGL